ncbi:hypothetical protein AWH56_020365 [Anaerobacillus isosaccharinicus]|uniref:Uncharacterized protein n=1 Tax=Anaerobacillus isosaccharinicus TaxID=1532552 RepID=A0A1S2KXW9_9BACI|nr:hypothetical protein [Anaerobacillus isosaccharinicus]MBA5586738.1 hypothetical protein [Anaerobacillus isosaccharinicus]QOY35040.1 hypothetical protein AWH56_020365 [Anaerobacillus isosaccharinicus]
MMLFNDSQKDFLNLTLKLFTSCLVNVHSTNKNELNSRFFDVLKSAYNRTCHHFYVSVNDETLHNLDQLKLEFENLSMKVDLYEDEDILMKTSTNIVVIHQNISKNGSLKLT